MSTNFEFNTSSFTIQEVSDYFAGLLGLERASANAPSPLNGPQWWAPIVSLDAQEFPDEGARLGTTDMYTSISFEPRKSVSWAEQTNGLVKILQGAINLLARNKDNAGYVMFYDEIIVLEKRRGGPIVLDARLVDPDDLDDLGAFASEFHGFPVVSIEQL
ncbi:hypothetical protein [Glycomyces sp. NPDC048151]|uniref:hypothetical protein n=1 Tax=Glycomyces sp. NPDC048151 TaxID=3364002 RepID=UPI0037195463